MRCEEHDSLENVGTQWNHPQLHWVADTIAYNIPEWTDVMLLHDNTQLHVANPTYVKLLEVEWEILLHPRYLLDSVPTVCHLFWVLQNFLNSKTFTTDELKTTAGDFRSAEFYNKGIHDQSQCWEQVIENNGDYINTWFVHFTALFHCISLLIKYVQELCFQLKSSEYTMPEKRQNGYGRNTLHHGITQF